MMLRQESQAPCDQPLLVSGCEPQAIESDRIRRPQVTTSFIEYFSFFLLLTRHNSPSSPRLELDYVFFLISVGIGYQP